MHSDALPPPRDQEPGWGWPVGLAALVHLLVALIFIVAWLWSPQRNTEAAAGDPAVQADMALSSAEASAARQALRQSERLDTLPEPLPEPEPEPIPDPVPEDTVPPPQPLPEPRPMDAPTPQQAQAQERVAQPDKVDQEAVNALAISQEKARQEQEAKRRQEQIDLTERKRQEEAEQKQRLAKQQEADRQKKIAEDERKASEAKAEQEKQKKLAELRARREKAENEAKLAEQRLRQVAAARNAAASANTSSAAQPAGGAGGSSDDLSAKYAAAIQAKVTDAWIRPDNIPSGQRCQITITQLRGGRVLSAKVSGSCPYDEAGKRSIEAAVLNAQPLPYAGFESVFNRELILNFRPD